MRKVRLLASAGAALMVLAVAGCSSPQQDGPADAEPAALRTEDVREARPAHAGDEAKSESADTFALVLPQWGTLHVPLGAGTTASQRDSDVPGTVRLRLEGRAPEPYVANLILLGVPEMMPGFGSDAWLKDELLRWKDDVSAADAPTPVEFWFDHLRGHYLTLEAPAPGPGQYPYLLQGFFNLDGCIVSFQVLHHEPRATAANRFLALITEARWEAERSAPEAPVS